MSTAPTPPTPTHKLTKPPWLRILYEVLHEVHAIKIRAKKSTRNRTMSKKVQILREKMG